MRCRNCDTELRPGAKFCPVCGTRVEQPAASAPPPSDQSSPAAGDDSGSGRIPRPPRPLRSHEDDADASSPSGALGALSASGVATAAPEDAPQPGPAPVAMADEPTPQPTPQPQLTPQVAPLAAPDVSGEHDDNGRGHEYGNYGGYGDVTAAPDGDMLVEDMPTAEQSAVLTGISSPSNSLPSISSPSNSAPSLLTPGTSTPHAETPAGMESAPADGMPWPLPASMIVGGRYRVEELLVPQGEDQPENIYRVSDLQAYEYCWACHAQHGIEAADQQYCPECGADMLARVFLMYERLLPSQAEPESDDPHDAVTLRDIDMPVDGEDRLFEQGQRFYRVTPRAVEEVLFPRGARIIGASASDAGITRPADHNEDSVGLFIYHITYNSRTEPLAVGVVSDGLGGHESGMEASRVAVRAVIETILREAALPGWGADGAAQELDAPTLLHESARAANDAVCDLNHSQQIDSGSTLVAVLIFGETAWIANMGDSRAYLFDRGQLRRISTDHSLVEQLVSAGMIKDEERYTHPQRNQVFRSLGTDEGVEPDIFTQSLHPGMRFLICSDGLWEMVRDPEIARILAEAPTVQQACDRLIAAANANGGEDNIAVVVLEVAG